MGVLDASAVGLGDGAFSIRVGLAGVFLSGAATCGVLVLASEVCFADLVLPVALVPVLALEPCALALALVPLVHLGAFMAWADGAKLILGALAGAALAGFAAKGERSTSKTALSVYLSICRVRYIYRTGNRFLFSLQNVNATYRSETRRLR